MDKKLETIINRLRKKVENFFKCDKSGHNIDHLERTLKYATFLQSKEGGDILVIGISAFIHDIHRIMSDKLDRYVSPEESLSVVEDFISDIKITEEQKTHILHAIKHHEEYNFSSGKKVKDIESKILQDADNLDAIGAIGLVRVLKYQRKNPTLRVGMLILCIFALLNFFEYIFANTLAHHSRFMRIGLLIYTVFSIYQGTHQMLQEMAL